MEITNNYMDYDEQDEQEKIAETEKMLMAVVGDCDFAIRFDDIVEIAQAEEIYPVPEFPDYVPGFSRIGESTVPIIDARKRFGFPAFTGERQCVVVAKDGNMKIGLLVDSVSKLRETKVEDIMPSVKVNDEAYTRYVTGMFKRSNGSLCYIICPRLMYTLTDRNILFADESSSDIKIEL